MGNPGLDPYGLPVRDPLSPAALAYGLLAETGTWGVNLHDNDLVPIDATPAERDQIVRGFTAVIVARPQEYLGQTVELVGDELTEAQIAETLARVIGRPVQLVAPRASGQPVDEESIAFIRFLNGQGYTADIPALRRAYPDLLTLERYLRQNGWENSAPVPLPQGAAA